MAVQILGLREWTNPKGKKQIAERFFDREWRAESVPDLFENIDSVLAQIPEEEHWNLYYTAASCKEMHGRILEKQNIIPIDIDGIDTDNPDKYVDLVSDELEIPKTDMGIVFSGNGLQFIIGTEATIEDVGFFDRERHLYKAMCGKLNQAMYRHGLAGKADTTVFSASRLLRLPNTKNIKKDKGVKQAYIINSTIKVLDFKLSEKTGLPPVVEGEHIHPRSFVKLPPPDTRGVLEGCDFIKHCASNQGALGEPQWYAMLSIVARLDDGDKLCHKFSEGHEQYDVDQTDFKIAQALDASGPRTCENIDTLWDGCNACPNKGKCRSPIMLKTDEYIGTQDTGFYDMVVDRNGIEKLGKPNYNDIVKYYYQCNPYTTMEIASIIHVHDGKMWEDISRNRIHAFAEDNFDPKPTHKMCLEFEQKLKRTEVREQDWYRAEGKINFANGVLRLADMQLLEHSTDYGFKYTLPFDYDPEAVCPRFDQFMNEITLDRQELIDILLEFMGYSVCNVDPLLGQKALILHGEGSNGKSVLIEVLRALAGKDNYSTLSMGNEINKLENRYQLSGKLFNISEETPTGSMVDSSVFKALVAGGEVQARKLYCDAFSMRNYAKIIMACNELPRTTDFSHGMLRRLIIVPFDATFTRANRDIHLVEKLTEELSGIFNRCVAGYRGFISRGSFAESTVVEQSIQSYVAENDTVMEFLEDECEILDEGSISTMKLYANYSHYCDSCNIKPLSKVQFGKRIKNRLLRKYGYDRSSRFREGDRQVRGFTGIRLQERGADY